MNQEEVLSAACLLMSIAKADEVIDEKEIISIKDILSDFFQISSQDTVNNIIQQSENKINNCTDIFEFGKILNHSWDYQDKIDFICCTFEVGISDGELHYIEEHAIKKIATILNVNHQDLIKAKIGIKKFL